MTDPSTGRMRPWPPTTADLAALMGGAGGTDGELRTLALDAAIDYVEGLEHLAVTESSSEAPAGVRFGTLLLAARLTARRNTPTGVSIADVGVAYVARTDPDIARFLRLGLPVVG